MDVPGVGDERDIGARPPDRGLPKLEIEPDMSIVVLDEDFLPNRRRAMEFRDCVKEGGPKLSIFAFASVEAISRYTVEEVLEVGIDGLWIGYEGTRSGYAKQEGRPVGKLFRERREHGISVLSSMIVGPPYQMDEAIDEELSGLLVLRPTLAQVMIYRPIPGTRIFEQVVREGRLADDLKADPICLAGRLLAPGREMRRAIGDLQRRVHASLGRATLAMRIASTAGVAMAAWTGLNRKLGLFQHPKLIRHTSRMPEESLPARAWRRLTFHLADGPRVEVELRPEATGWVRIAGKLNAAAAEALSERSGPTRGGTALSSRRGELATVAAVFAIYR